MPSFPFFAAAAAAPPGAAPTTGAVVAPKTIALATAMAANAAFDGWRISGITFRFWARTSDGPAETSSGVRRVMRADSCATTEPGERFMPVPDVRGVLTAAEYSPPVRSRATSPAARRWTTPGKLLRAPPPGLWGGVLAGSRVPRLRRPDARISVLTPIYATFSVDLASLGDCPAARVGRIGARTSARENGPLPRPWMETGQLADVLPGAQPHPGTRQDDTCSPRAATARALRAPAISGPRRQGEARCHSLNRRSNPARVRGLRKRLADRVRGQLHAQH